ncbi:DUF2975 domain-containing protein [Paenibacillus sp. J2TS4]|uniref:DUF2975 domain-containing protein n=1 Tax=Paenibacillus sp. J2TS4 TaxID=2807194 RepID=UPI001B297DCA|nr:DUF2975 domain-containing protein [Paenibacillus sp. J2TS4]GIP36542.1 hypothetical protein J2TS4_57520 [Paenibacillus sp. J2TS4]
MGNNTKAAAHFQKMYVLLQWLLWGVILVFILLVASDVWISLKPQEQFTAEKGIAHWSFSVALSETTSRSILIPFQLFQPISPDKFSAKSAFLVTELSSTFLTFITYIYSILQIRNIIGSMVKGNRPFDKANIVRLKRLGIAVILYSLLAKLIINVLCWVFVNHIFAINLSGISLKGVIIGLLVLIVSDVFKHGVYLQEEHDMTI